ncbi:uncharacterized protein LOC111366485 [Olea europaea var. sylvestris]|uniref:uncharacterized protein LOC111366485 n=1 Tax=Olea europaea var. sylvestris TaxID=158386 RepID=UPI000C1D0BC7|nr:uncharacterized protein LOC111366485 [Olea europaea var. sylvestris]
MASYNFARIILFSTILFVLFTPHQCHINKNAIEQGDTEIITPSNASQSDLKEEKIHLDFCKNDKCTSGRCWCCLRPGPYFEVCFHHQDLCQAHCVPYSPLGKHRKILP